MTDQNREPDRVDPEPAEAAQVSRQLAGAPVPPMPPDVAARLDAVLTQESARRNAQVSGTAGTGGLVDRGTKPFLLSPDTRPPARGRAAGVVLVAAVSAAAVGAAGYALSASAGLNEPSAVAPFQVQSSELADQAREIASTRDLSAHTFSGAWRCARTVTSGRITALTPASVDGTPALLVYTRVRGESWVTVVTGCPQPGALARESVRLPG